MFVEFIEVVPEVLEEEAHLAGLRACKFQDSVHSISSVGNTLRATSVGVRIVLWCLCQPQ